MELPIDADTSKKQERPVSRLESATYPDSATVGSSEAERSLFSTRVLVDGLVKA